MERRIESIEALRATQAVGHKIARKESKVDARLRREWADVLREQMEEEKEEERQEQDEERQLRQEVDQHRGEANEEELAEVEAEAIQRERIEFVRAHPDDLLSAHLLGPGHAAKPDPIGHWVDSEA